MIPTKDKRPLSVYVSVWALLQMAYKFLKSVGSAGSSTDQPAQTTKLSPNISIYDKQKYVFRRNTLSEDELKAITNAIDANPNLNAEMETLLKNKKLHELEHSMDEISE